MATIKPNSIDWEVPEYQNALKVVIKYEIQNLLERLSQTGEETVVLTANTTDLCVGHLASEKGKRFLSTSEVGEMKNKFLYFCTVEGAGGSGNESGLQVTVLPQKKVAALTPSARGRSRGATTTARGARQTAGLTGNKATTGTGRGRGNMAHSLMSPQHPASFTALSETDVKAKLPNVKTGEKRQHPFTSEEIQDMIVSAENKRRKTDSDKYALGSQGQSGSYMKSLDTSKSNVQKVDNLPQNKQILVADDDSNDIYDEQDHHIERLGNDGSSVGIKEPHFTHDNLEYQKFLKQYNDEVGIKYADDESDYDEEFNDDELEEYELAVNKLEKGLRPDSHHLTDRTVTSQGQIHHSQTSQSHFTPSQFQRQFQNFNKNNQNPQSVTKPGLVTPSSNIEKKDVSDKVYKDAKVDSSLQSIINKATQKLEQSDPKKQIVSASDGSQEFTEIKEELDPDDLDYKQCADSSTSGVKQQADSSNQRLETSPRQSEVQLPDTTQHNRGPHTLPSGQATSPRPAVGSEKQSVQDRAEADVSAKLGLLSGKLSWVVEYPSNFNPKQGQKQLQQQQQQQHQQQQQKLQQQQQQLQQQQQQPQQQDGNFQQQHGNLQHEADEEDYPEDYDEDEDYDEEDGELDEDDLNLMALRHYQNIERQRGNLGQGTTGQATTGQGFQQFDERFRQGMGGQLEEDYDEEDYNEEDMEHLDDEDYEGEYGELDSEDERALREMDELRGQGMLGRLQQGGAVGPAAGNNSFVNTSSETENYLLMGAMAKCLVCNKLVRKNDIVQHNLIHSQEIQEEDDGELNDIDEDLEEMHGNMGDMPDHMEGMHDNMEGMHDNLEGTHDNMEGMGEEMDPEIHGLNPESGEDAALEALEDQEETGEAMTQLTAERVTGNSCPVCQKIFKTQKKLENHIKTHDPKEFVCQFCNKTFRLQSYLDKHQRKMHRHEVGVKEEQFNCGVCQTVFHSQQEVEQHMLTHSS